VEFHYFIIHMLSNRNAPLWGNYLVISRHLHVHVKQEKKNTVVKAAECLKRGWWRRKWTVSPEFVWQIHLSLGSAYWLS